MSTTLTLNGTPVPASITFEATLNPVQRSAERNGNGTLIRETLPNKWSIKFEWKFATPEELYPWFAFLVTLMRVDFTVVFPAPTGNTETITCYISPVTAKMLNYAQGTVGNWREMTATIVEV